jgi:two-component system chemotaxis sensor kinase CheA
MLLEMINDLLDLAKIEAGRLQVRCEKVPTKDIVEVVCNMVRPMLADTPLAFSFDVDPAVPLMMTDATKVQQILYNLLANAIKFTEQGEVRVTVRPAPNPDQEPAPVSAGGMPSPALAGHAPHADHAHANSGPPQGGQAAGPPPAPAGLPAPATAVTHVAFAVSDTGPGISRDEQLRIFERFTQLDSGHTRRYRGTGLGLSIVKELTGLLGGTVRVDSEVGRGSTFTVTLPVDSSAAEARKAEGAAAAAEKSPKGAAGGAAQA